MKRKELLEGNRRYVATGVVGLASSGDDVCLLLSPNMKLVHCIAQPRTETIDLEADNSLRIEISDALSEQDKVKFTIHTKVGARTQGHTHSRDGSLGRWVGSSLCV